MKHTKVDLLVMDFKRNSSSSHYRIIKNFNTAWQESKAWAERNKRVINN
ncbi:hypothetical protein OKE80_10200 [Riemerella anatipestifer]|uniref:Uncharacterized protein n=1 Tax=Riemerella anatipestifer TaxID=34085 RepID=A0AAP3AND4_RIEAN|nr:hypothetical protein [Riemerella anatipestifer]MCO7319682.1 hypothetical protein [Riemerella anatipestifer]MCQ4156045.1 hypothetical protein [Riemerella anatipestifer]MCQ4181930.1 hypothetical protein [Riemerella anatipestifer]MCU7567779.1 hypothetical protein [Riemerella anatipestifer]MCW0475180.1 hypothetical protein [Riemerella anatipestifer]